MGHTSLTHAFLLKGEDPTLSVKHFLLDCPGLNTSRMLFYEVTSLKAYLMRFRFVLFLLYLYDICVFVN